MGIDVVAHRVSDNYGITDMDFSRNNALYTELYDLMGVSDFRENHEGVGWKIYTTSELKHKWKVAHSFINDKWQRKQVKHFLRMCIDYSNGEDVEISFI
jgi:hypothetical protein